MGLFDFLLGPSNEQKSTRKLSKFYGGLATDNLPQGIAELWKTINSPGLTPGAQAQKSIFDSDLLGGYQRAQADSLRSNTERGMGTSLLNMGTNAALGRSYAGDKARYAGGLMGQSEEEKKRMLQFLMQLVSGAGNTAIGGYQASASMDPLASLLGMAGQVGAGFAGRPKLPG